MDSLTDAQMRGLLEYLALREPEVMETTMQYIHVNKGLSRPSRVCDMTTLLAFRFCRSGCDVEDVVSLLQVLLLLPLSPRHRCLH
jgi:hypothetical protein